MRQRRHPQGFASKAGIPAAPSTSGKVLKASEEKHVRKIVAEIAEKDTGLESRIKCAVGGALRGDKVRLAISTVVADVLTKDTVINVLVDALKDHEGYKQHLTACMGRWPDALLRSTRLMYSRRP